GPAPSPCVVPLASRGRAV
ncbi:diguanylate cyclase, partial [Streptomyces sp. A012304]